MLCISQNVDQRHSLNCLPPNHFNLAGLFLRLLLSATNLSINTFCACFKKNLNPENTAKLATTRLYQYTGFE